MSDTTAPGTKSRPEIWIVGVIAVLLIGVFWYVSGERQTQLRRSPAGMDGLHAWLQSQDIDSRTFTGGWSIEADTVGLRVMPLYDTNVRASRAAPTTKEELLLQIDENDMRSWPLIRKREVVPTLYVLPKWRSGMRLTGIGHPALLIPQDDVERILGSVVSERRNDMVFSRAPFTDIPYEADGETLTARLYAAQLFEGRFCDPVIGEPGAMLLASCRLPVGAGRARGTGRYFVLSDPDLLNNHGLRLGDNAAIAADLLPKLGAEGTIMIDYSDDVWISSGASFADTGERTWSDLWQFFAYPFSILWASAGFLMLLALWRAALRYGPILPEGSASSAQKAVAIRARARLMRLSGQDGALIGDYAQTRIAAVAAHAYGPSAAQQNAEAVVLRLARARGDGRDTALKATLERIKALPVYATASDAIAEVDALESILSELSHES